MYWQYVGFENSQDERQYRFHGLDEHEQPLRVVVTARLDLFSIRGVHLEDAPIICLHRLAQIDAGILEHEHRCVALTEQDIRSYVAEHKILRGKRGRKLRGELKRDTTS